MSVTITSVSANLYCACGAYLNFRGPPESWLVACDKFSADHLGLGHARCSRKQAMHARRRKLRQAKLAALSPRLL